MTTFSTWITAPENVSATLAMQAVVEDLCSTNRDRECNPVLLHGLAGTGKSHLVSAVVSEVTQRRPDIVVSRTSAGDLEQLLRHEEEGAPSVHVREMKEADLLIIEDLQHLGQHAIEQLTLIIDKRHARQRQMIFTSLQGPGQLRHLPSRLTSRLACGLVVGLLTLSPQSRRPFLLQRMEQRKLQLPSDVVDWIVQHLGGSARELEGALSRVEILAQTLNQPLSVDAVEDAFAEDVEARRPTVERIAQRVSRYFQLELKQLRNRSRAHHTLLPRQVGMYLAREMTQLSLKQIGDYFGGRDHSTVLHACRKVEKALQADQNLSGVVQELQAALL